ncbi:MAG: malto-oligosyltrehalose synthase [Methanothrix sp.]|nr:malto-oligosyltrehalose synthase [Methanothrix sp.]
MKARKGSSHGYDVVDHNRLNPELGTLEEFEDLLQEVSALKMGWLQDVVPNHASYSHENDLLSDVLERGKLSEFFSFFDVEWDHPSDNLKGKIQAPFLEEFYRDALEKGDIRLEFSDAGFAISCSGIRLPVRLKSYAAILSYGLRDLEKGLKEDTKDLEDLKSIILKVNEEDPNPELKEELWKLCSESSAVRGFIDSNLAIFNGRAGDIRSFDFIDDLLSTQIFRLCFWKVASDEINYRRFFVLNDMISLNTEKKEVFDHIHSFLFDLLRRGLVTGLRIDHLDGLYDPEEYLTRLREHLSEGYLVAEKILLPGESLPNNWPLQGTTGYDFLNCQNGVFCDKDGVKALDEIYSRFTGLGTSFEDVAYEKKLLIADRHMNGDFDNLARILKKALGRGRRGVDITLSGIKKALKELMILLPVYRTYVRPGSFREFDRRVFQEAFRLAKQRNLDLFYELDLIQRFMLEPGEDDKDNWLAFIMRLQQFSGPLMAKGIEDTALYSYFGLLSLNEVGGNPGSAGTSLDEFHRFNRHRSESWPHSMNATSTHDTKRGEDARARINVLSELPEIWSGQIDAWSRINEGKKEKVMGRDVPDKNDEYFLYQALIGAFPHQSEDLPSFRKRIKGYLIKAVREAKVHSGWVRQERSYEEAFTAFLERALDSEKFMGTFLPFQRKISHHGALNSLATALVKITAPGIPDFYQGCELWDLSFVDPDNRRPVKFERMATYLKELVQADVLSLIEELLAGKEDARLKLFIIHQSLRARSENPELFTRGSYEPLKTEGARSENIIAFARKHNDLWAITVVPRLTTALVGEGDYPLGRKVWSDDQIPLFSKSPHYWRNAITGQPLEAKGQLYAGDVLQHFPVALLIGREGR